VPSVDATGYSGRMATLGDLAGTLEQRVREALEDVPHIDRIAFRAKDLASFIKKAEEPRYASPLTDIEDQVAGRVITFFLDDMEPVKQRLVDLFGPVEHVVKEPAGAAEFGYESEHFVFVISEHHKPEGWSDHEAMPKTFEMQVRTIFMHAWAEPQHDLGYKPSEGNLDRETQRELAWVAASAWGADRVLNDVARRLGED
jgi:putative GTP pyrophosphokinase